MPQMVPTFVMNQPTGALSYTRKETNHTFHLLMTLLTCGMWAIFVWGPITIYNAMRKDKTVTKFR
jgi:hypothetical protein